MAGILWFAGFQLLGQMLSYCVFPGLERPKRIWLGSVCGMAAAIWSPILFAFTLGFTEAAHASGLALAAVICAAVFIFRKRKLCKLKCDGTPEISDATDLKNAYASGAAYADTKLNYVNLISIAAAMVLCTVILSSHTLYERDGALYTGQCTYGDMAMHIGFITSLAEQQSFPPFYSILPSEKLCYPFLCDSISASLYLLGTGLRAAYIIPMLFALMNVFTGAMILCGSICRKKGAAQIAWVLFFLCGGFGTLYFFGDYTFSDLFTGFYNTPTNLTNENIRWVNVIADMLIPQRATLFGWSILFACLWMLYMAVFEDKERLWLPAGILGGLLPMVHTHSYFALGLTAACWLVASLIRDGWNRRWLKGWLLFGLPAVIIAAPQVFYWTLDSVSGNGQFLRLNLDWVNGFGENWLLFWVKNVGPVFIIFPLAYIFASREKKAVFAPALFIFILCELVVFQPNVYDNNKLLYIAYFFACLLSADGVLAFAGRYINSRALRGVLVAALRLVCTNAALLTLAREVLSGADGYAYMLFSADEVEAAEFIRENTEPDALFLTDDNHDNTVAVLTGRNILCGSPSYLYYHGTDYRPAQELEQAMLQSPEGFEAGLAESGIDYVFISEHERSVGYTLEPYLDANYEQVFSNGTVSIYSTNRIN